MKRAVVVNQSAGYLTIDICNALCLKFDQVVLLSAPVGRLERVPDSRVKILEIVRYSRKNSISRLITWMIASVQISWFALRYKFEIVYFSTNPPFAYLIGYFLRSKFCVIVYDIYPHILKNIGINESNIIFKSWSRLNKVILPKAESVFTLSKGMAVILSQYSPSNIKVVNNWGASQKFVSIQKQENLFIKKNGLAGKFIVMYSGNMGLTHDVETMIHVAQKLSLINEIAFIFIGDGGKKEKLIKLSCELELINCLFFGRQDEEMFLHSLSAADVGVVTVNSETGMLSVPSKTYNLMAAGIPLLCIAPENSEVANLIKNFRNGKSFDARRIEEIAEFIEEIYKNVNLRNELSKNSIKASDKFTYINAEEYIL